MFISGLSGNEIYCLAQKGWAPGDIVVGNSVYSLGFVRGLTSGFQTLAGGEIDIRHRADLRRPARRHPAAWRKRRSGIRRHGLTGVTSDLKRVSGLMEFLAIGSAVKGSDHAGPFFTTACSGQDLYCQMDAGYEPRHFVIGNVAYALGVGRGIMGVLRGFAGGEVKEFSDMYNHTRHLALERLEKEARDAAPTPSSISSPTSCRSAPASRKC